MTKKKCMCMTMNEQNTYVLPVPVLPWIPGHKTPAVFSIAPRRPLALPALFSQVSRLPVFEMTK
jgi:hypothetical protein